MMATRPQAALDRVRGAMVSVAARHPSTRRVMARSGRRLRDAAEQGAALAQARAAGVADTYDGSYFGEGRDASGDRAGRSGYARYDRIASNADIAGWLLWRNFRVGSALDVGCATGFLVEVLRERGIDAEGCDLSEYAVDHASPGAAGHIRVANLFSGLPWPDGHFELVTVLETLEHLPPDLVPAAVRELRRVCGGYLYATIPSFGPNVSGPDGHFEGKVRPELVEAYADRGPDYGGPVAGGGPGHGRRRPTRRGASDHCLLRLVDGAVRRGRVHPLPRRGAASLRGHRAGRAGPVLEPLRVRSAGRAGRSVRAS